MSIAISTHVLDTALGVPARGIAVQLISGGAVIAHGTTDADGRIVRWESSDSLAAGPYALRFHVAEYFAATSRAAFYAAITVDFLVESGQAKYHVPLLLSPYGYSTYRGS